MIEPHCRSNSFLAIIGNIIGMLKTTIYIDKLKKFKKDIFGGMATVSMIIPLND
jgi:hypothetical protein